MSSYVSQRQLRKETSFAVSTTGVQLYLLPPFKSGVVHSYSEQNLLPARPLNIAQDLVRIHYVLIRYFFITSGGVRDNFSFPWTIDRTCFENFSGNNHHVYDKL